MIRFSNYELNLEIIRDPAIIALILTAVGVGIATTAILYMLIYFVWPLIVNIIVKLRSSRPAFNPNVLLKPTAVANWINAIFIKLKKANVGLRADRIAILCLGLAACGFVLGIFLFKNLMAAILLALTIFVIPEQILVSRIQKRREVLSDQLAPASKMLHTEIMLTQNPLLALKTISENIGEPLKGVLKTTHRRLELNAADPNRIFADMAKELDLEYGRLFAHLLKETFTGKDTFEMLDELALKCFVYSRISRNNKKILAWLRAMATILITLTIPLLIFDMVFWVSAREYLTQTQAGRIIVVISLMAIIINSIVQRMLSHVQY